MPPEDRRPVDRYVPLPPRMEFSLRQSFAWWCPRVLFGALVLVGLNCTITGLAQQADVNGAFDIHFGQPDETCDSGDFLYLNTETGEPLQCRVDDPEGIAVPWAAGDGPPGMPYFTEQQDREGVLALARNLGADGLTEAEQEQVQEEVDAIAATLPDEEKPYNYSGLWGATLVFTGLGIILLGIALYRSPLLRRLESLLGGSRSNV